MYIFQRQTGSKGFDIVFKVSDNRVGIQLKD